MPKDKSKPPLPITTYSALTLYWTDKVEKGEKMELSNDTCQLTYKVKDSAIHIEWAKFDRDKVAFIRRRMTVPLYNVKYMDEVIEEEITTDDKEGEQDE